MIFLLQIVVMYVQQRICQSPKHFPTGVRGFTILIVPKKLSSVNRFLKENFTKSIY